MDPFEPAVAGLRERSKKRRREAIQRAAMRLFAEQGYEATTIADIAAAAEVSARTVSMYFPTKSDLATSHGSDIARRLAATLQADPELDFLDALESWLTGEAATIDPETAQLSRAMNEANPGLAAMSSAAMSDAIEVAGAAFTAHLGLPPEDPMLRVCGAALAGIIATYLGELTAGNPPADLHERVLSYTRAVVEAARR